MLARLRAILPTMDAREGTAEAIPLEDGSVDAVTVAQAFHWFEPQAALREIHRVLRPEGGVALFWNSRELDDPLQAAWGEIVREAKGSVLEREMLTSALRSLAAGSSGRSTSTSSAGRSISPSTNSSTWSGRAATSPASMTRNGSGSWPGCARWRNGWASRSRSATYLRPGGESVSRSRSRSPHRFREPRAAHRPNPPAAWSECPRHREMPGTKEPGQAVDR
jgi:SAM-dependent methyltransferase